MRGSSGALQGLVAPYGVFRRLILVLQRLAWDLQRQPGVLRSFTWVKLAHSESFLKDSGSYLAPIKLRPHFSEDL